MLFVSTVICFSQTVGTDDTVSFRYPNNFINSAWDISVDANSTTITIKDFTGDVDTYLNQALQPIYNHEDVTRRAYRFVVPAASSVVDVTSVFMDFSGFDSISVVVTGMQNQETLGAADFISSGTCVLDIIGSPIRRGEEPFLGATINGHLGAVALATVGRSSGVIGSLGSHTIDLSGNSVIRWKLASRLEGTSVQHGWVAGTAGATTLVIDIAGTKRRIR